MRKEFHYFNIPLVELTSRVFQSGSLSFKGSLVLFSYYLKLTLALPATFFLFIFYSIKIKKTKILKDPVFIIGHYRSGTTYLHKLIASDKRFGFLSNFDSVFPNSNIFLGKQVQRFMQFLVNKLKIKNPFFNNSIAQLGDPAEEDHFLISKASAFSAYWRFIFPLRSHEWLNGSKQFGDKKYCEQWKREYLDTVKFITFKNKGRQLVLKNPPNTERIKYLLELFPNAKFIYLFRNPIDVFCSMKNVWKNAILKLYCLQNLSEEQIDEIVLEHFTYLTGQYEKDKKLIPEENLIEVQYEEFEKNTFNTVRKIYSKLNLHNFDETVDDLLTQLAKEKQYHKFKHQLSEETYKKVEERLKKYNKIKLQTQPGNNNKMQHPLKDFIAD